MKQTLEVQADYSRYRGEDLRDTMTVEATVAVGSTLRRRLYSFLRPKCHAVLLVRLYCIQESRCQHIIVLRAADARDKGLGLTSNRPTAGCHAQLSTNRPTEHLPSLLAGGCKVSRICPGAATPPLQRQIFWRLHPPRPEGDGCTHPAADEACRRTLCRSAGRRSLARATCLSSGAWPETIVVGCC